MSIKTDAIRLVAWLDEDDRRDTWLTLDQICEKFGWQPSAKTYRRMAVARKIADEAGCCLTFATWDRNVVPRYMLTHTEGDNVVPGISTRAASASTQWDNISRAGRFVQRHGSDRLTKQIGTLAAETAESSRRTQLRLAKILSALADGKKDGDDD